jgi:hypothetical protein
MSDAAPVRERFEAAIDAIEGGYELLLAYAAQGRHTDRGAAQGPRPRLTAMVEALVALPMLARAVVSGADAAAVTEGGAFFDALTRDAAVAAAAVRLVLSKPDISSQLVDNLNASIHLRAVLTDIFLLDELYGAKP